VKNSHTQSVTCQKQQEVNTATVHTGFISSDQPHHVTMRQHVCTYNTRKSQTYAKQINLTSNI